MTPYYLSVRQTDIVEHYRAIAGQAPAPVIPYNIPSNTHNLIELETELETFDQQLSWSTNREPF